jgi:hypothetical protein
MPCQARELSCGSGVTLSRSRVWGVWLFLLRCAVCPEPRGGTTGRCRGVRCSRTFSWSTDMPGRGGWIWALPMGRGDSISRGLVRPRRVMKHDVGLRADGRTRRWHMGAAAGTRTDHGWRVQHERSGLYNQMSVRVCYDLCVRACDMACGMACDMACECCCLLGDAWLCVERKCGCCSSTTNSAW